VLRVSKGEARERRAEKRLFYLQTAFACSSLYAVLEKYGLIEFVAVSEAIRTGNLRKFNDALLEYQHRFIR
jgi:hypothetical protein